MNVYDFDNTIYDGETLVDFILYYVKTDPRIWKYIPKLLVIAFKDKFHLFTVEEAITAYAGFWRDITQNSATLMTMSKNFGTKTSTKSSRGMQKYSVRTILSFQARPIFA